MLANITINLDAFAALPPAEFKHLAALLQYADRAGVCSVSLPQLAIATHTSKTATSRIMAALAKRGCVARTRTRNGERYVYIIATRFLPPPPTPRGLR